jgi:hypothetical protein
MALTIKGQVRGPGVRDWWNFSGGKKVNIDDVDNQVSTLKNTLICINLNKVPTVALGSLK